MPWVKSKRDGGVQFFPDDWEYTAYHMASGLFEEISDPAAQPEPAQEPVEAAPASGASEPQRPASGLQEPKIGSSNKIRRNRPVSRK
jgi:hypothetical protein